MAVINRGARLALDGLFTDVADHSQIGAYGFWSRMRTISDSRRGSSPARRCFTNASFTTKPGAGLASSASVNSRP